MYEIDGWGMPMCVCGVAAAVVGARGPRIRRPGMAAGRLGSSKTPRAPPPTAGAGRMECQESAPLLLGSRIGTGSVLFSISNTVGGPAPIWAPLKGARAMGALGG